MRNSPEPKPSPLFDMDSIPTALDFATDYGVYTGIWTDWSHGKIFGATLTTTRTSGSLLIAFLSLFVAVAGTCFWRIGCFFFHYIYSTEASRDGLYHQRQAVLRNSANAVAGLTSLFQIFCAWRHSQPTKGRYQRILPLAAFTLLTLAAFAVASTFSSRISTIAGNAVLISSSNCGLIGPETVHNMTDSQTILAPYISGRILSSVNYVQQCYTDGPSTEGCNRFVQRRLPTKAIRNAPCPFAKSICESQDENILLDSGFLSSHDHFGWNAPPSQRFQHRVVTHCAPLVTDGYKEDVSRLGPSLNQYTRYYYGEALYGPSGSTNFTFQHPVLQKDQAQSEGTSGPNPDFDVKVYTAEYYNGTLSLPNSILSPIDELVRTDADVILMFLSANSVLFTEQSNAPWYSAQVPCCRLTELHLEEDNDALMYYSDETSSPLACTRQYQFCKSNSGVPKSADCTPLSSFIDALAAASTMWPGDTESRRFENFFLILRGPIDPFGGVIRAMGPQALDSSSRKGQGQIGPLPRNQWQLDMEKLHNGSLAFLQRNFIETATGPADARLQRWMYESTQDLKKGPCKNQKILSTTYTNFSVFGLSTILIVGGLIIITSYALEPLVVWIQHRRNLDVYARIEWTMNETLQLQRLAHEELGLGTWRRCNTDIPVTERLERLGVLDLDDRGHPRLKAPPALFEEVLNEGVENRKSRENVEAEEGMTG